MKNEQEKYHNIFLISGTGRKTGKTSFACQLIREYASLNIISFKFSCHFYSQNGVPLLFSEQDQFQIYKEINPLGQKDSSRMLAEGAKDVYYIQAEKKYTFEAFQKIYRLIPENVPVLCESGGLGNYLSPGMHVVLKRPLPLASDKFINYQPDLFIEMNSTDFTVPPQNFLFSDGKWKHRKQKPFKV